MFPNPAKNQSTVRLNVGAKTKVKLTIYDNLGKIVSVPVNNEQKEKGLQDININLAKFGNGVYYAVLANNNQTVQSVKFIVNK